MTEAVIDYTPMRRMNGFPQVDSLPQFGNQNSAFFPLYLLTQFDAHQATAFQSSRPQLERKETQDILQDHGFFESPFGNRESIGYWRNFVRFIQSQEWCDGIKDKIWNLIQQSRMACDLKPLDYAMFPNVMPSPFERMQLALRERCLGVRNERVQRQLDSKGRGMAGFATTYSKIGGDTYVPVVLLDPAVPFETYSTQMASAGVFIVLDSDSIQMAKTTDFGSDRLGEIAADTGYQTADRDGKIDYFQKSVGLTGSIIRQRAEWTDKMAEVALRRSNGRFDKSGKFSLKVHYGSLENCPKTDTEIKAAIASLENQPLTGKNEQTLIRRQCIQALKKLLKKQPEQRLVYLNRAFSATPKMGKYQGDSVRHNEVLILLRQIEQVEGILVNLGLPSTYAQSLDLQREIANVNGGESLPLVLYSPIDCKIVEISPDTLRGIEKAFEALRKIDTNDQNVAVQHSAILEQLVAQYPEFQPIQRQVEAELIQYLTRYWVTEGNFTPVFQLFKSHHSRIAKRQFSSIFLNLSQQSKSNAYLNSTFDQWIPLIAPCLEDNDSKAIENLVLALANLAVDPLVKAKLAANDELLQTLVTFLATGPNRAKAHAVLALSNLATVPIAVEKLIANKDLLRSLFTFLETGTKEEKTNTTLALANYAADPRARAKLAANDELLQSLVTFLATGENEAKANAVLALARLSADPIACSKLAANDELLRGLVTLLETGTEKVQTNAIHAIANITADPIAGAKLAVNNEIFQSLVIRLATGTDWARKNVASALANLAADPLARTKLAANDELLQSLVTLFLTGTDGAKTNATIALANLAADPLARTKLAANDELLHSLVALFLTETDGAKINATIALANLAADPLARTKLATNDELLQSLVTLIVTGSDRAKKYAAAALANLSIDPAALAKLVKIGELLGILVTLLATGPNGAKTNAALALANLAMDRTIKVKVAANDALIQNLVTLLASGTEIVQEKIALTLTRLAVNPEALDKFRGSRQIKSVIWPSQT